MAETAEGNDATSYKKRKVAKSSVVAPSQYLFATDYLSEDADTESPVRVSNRFQWILTNINFTIGLGPLWRFPVTAYRMSGGPFVVAYTLIFICVGYPLALMEVALGQCTRRRAATVFKLCTAFEGLSVCMGLYSFVISIYYNVIFAYALKYFYHTFAPSLEWKSCKVLNLYGYVCYKDSLPQKNGSYISPEEVFWRLEVLGGVQNYVVQRIPPLNGSLVFCLAVSWSLVGILLLHRIRKYSFAAEYFLIPLTILIIVLITVLHVSLSNKSGVHSMVTVLRDFFVPSSEIFKNVQIWREATQEVLFSLGIASGSLITLGSLSHFKSPVHIDSAIVCVVNYVFSLISGVAVFYAATNVAKEIRQKVPVVERLELHGPGIFFIALTKVLGELPLSQLWSATFFLLLFILGSRAVVGSIDTTVSVVRYFIRHSHRRSFKILYAGLIIVVCGFLLGLSAVTKGDNLVFIVLDRFGGATSLPMLATLECIAVVWIYGVVRFSGDIAFMLDYKPNILLRIIWIGIPLYLIILLATSWIHCWVLYPNGDIEPFPYFAAGWLLVLVILLPLIIRFIFNCMKLYRKKRLKEIFMSRDDAGPDDLELWYRNEHFFDRISVLMSE